MFIASDGVFDSSSLNSVFLCVFVFGDWRCPEALFLHYKLQSSSWSCGVMWLVCHMSCVGLLALEEIHTFRMTLHDKTSIWYDTICLKIHYIWNKIKCTFWVASEELYPATLIRWPTYACWSQKFKSYAASHFPDIALNPRGLQLTAAGTAQAMFSSTAAQ